MLDVMQSTFEYVHTFKSSINVYYYNYNNLIFEILTYFDSGYLQPDTSYIKKN